MEFDEVIARRYSVRKYAPQKVEPEKIDKILQAGQLAPSAVNFQPVQIIVVQKEQGLSHIAEATKWYNAPLAFIVCADTSVAWTRNFDGKNHADIDASIMTDHMMLEATNLGLGTVWICRFKPEIIRTAFELPANLEPINILAVGYPDASSEPSKMHTSRKPLDSYVHYEQL